MNRKKYSQQAACLLTIVVMFLLGGSFVRPANARMADTPQVPTPLDAVSSAMDKVNVTAARPWTAQEMRAAKLTPAPGLTEEEINRAAAITTTPQGPTGPARTLPSALPKTPRVVTDKELFAPLTISDQQLQASRRFFRHEVYGTSYVKFPHMTIGRLFYNIPGDPNGHSCTAASIGNNAIWTAGHCVHSGNNAPSGWSTNVVFAPAYRDGVSPLGQWTANQLWTKTVWYQNGVPLGRPRDMGGAILNVNVSGQKISQVVGNLGFAWNWPRSEYYAMFGYPGAPAPPFSPLAPRMFVCNGAGDYYWLWLGYGKLMQIMGCDMGPGSSGGPWIIYFSANPGPTNYLNGNMSSSLASGQEGVSPYFDDGAKSLWDCLVNGC